MLQLGLGLGLGTGNGYFFLFPYLKVTNTFVLPSWAEAWCKCDIMQFIRDCLLPSILIYMVGMLLILLYCYFFTKIQLMTMATSRTIFGGGVVGVLLLE